MQTITFPLRINMKRDEVSYLHKVLEQLGFRIDRREKLEKRFGRSTRQAVLEFQKKYRLNPTGEVDEKTANQFNALLKRPKKSKKRLFDFPRDNPTKKDIGNLHAVLKKLKLEIDDEEVNKNVLGVKTSGAIKKFQKKSGMTPDGKLTSQTIDQINIELAHVYYAYSRTRSKKLHTMLERLGYKLDKEELKNSIVGESTEKAIKEEQEKLGLPSDGKLNESMVNTLNEKALEARLIVKTQIGKLHNIIKHAVKIAKISVEISVDELKNKKIGTSTSKAIKAFQEKYKLSATGEMNKATLDKLTSVAASKGKYVKKLKSPPVKELQIVTKTLRLNMVSPQVAEMQKALSFLGYKISEKEFKTQTFGKTTIKAIKKLQKEKGTAQTGHFDKATKLLVNNLTIAANPRATTKHRYRIRGSVRNELWQRKNKMVIKIYEKILDQESAQPLAAMKNFLNGFFDIAYDAPINPVNGQVKEKFHLVVKLYDENDQQNPVAIQTHYNVNPIHWVNFTGSKSAEGTAEYNGKYAGESDFEVTRAILQKAIGSAKIENLKETETDKQISQLSLQTGLSTDDIMCHVLSRLVAKSVNVLAKLNAEVFYAFIRQNLPADLPGDLLRGTSEWETIDQFTENTSSGIVFLDDAIKLQAIENAVLQNLVSQKIKVNKDAVLEELNKQRNNFTLTKPILVGNTNLRTLLNQSNIKDAADQSAVATVFINNKGINSSFWEEIKTHEAAIGADAIADFATTVEIGNISKNHIPTITFLKNKIGSKPDKLFKTASDIAKLDPDGLVDLINQNGKKVPDNMPGTLDEKVANYAAAMKSRAEFLYPAVSLVAAVKRSKTPNITKITEVQNFIDEQKELNFRQQNIDKYLLDHPEINIDAKTKEELKIVQRVHKITTNSSAGAALIDEGLHSSMQIYFMGKDRLTTIMTEKKVEAAHIHRVYESSKMQYMQILARLVDFRREIHRHTPQAILPHIYTKTEIQKAIGDIPDLETLFGTLDYCDCEHCKSLYGPAAYLTDMLRFLDEHLAIDKSKTVKDILFERRPDLGNIKLNCVNTETQLPYIDLVCEILENNLIGNNNFVYQTTLSQKELRAIPQYVQSGAYTTIANADFPMNISLNLWQEEARTYLNYLRIPRFELMEAFQDKSDLNNKIPDDAAIAAEYFGISSKEKDLIVSKRRAAIDQDKYWGFDTTQTSIPVSLFMKRTKLSYYEVLELLLVRFVNNPAAPSVSKIERPIDTCDVDLQVVTNLTPQKFDLVHRFIRLWRRTGWKMWELDLLIRNSKIGNNVIKGATLANLKRFKQLQEKLNLPFETLLAFFGDINREVRIKPDKPDVIMQPLYNKLFQNQSVTNPVDTYFKALDVNNDPIALDGNIIFGINTGAPYNGYTPIPTILSALALKRTDFDLLADKTNNYLSVDSLSILLRYAYLARSLKVSITDLLLFLGITNNSDPFSSLQVTLDSIKYLEHIKSSGLSFRELDYILNYNSDSPIGLRDESIIQLIDSLRKILETYKEKNDELNAITIFNADALAPLADDALMTLFAPFQSSLISIKDNVVDDNFLVSDANFILQFEKSEITPTNKTKLIDTIKKLQQNISKAIDALKEEKQNQIKSHIASSFNITDEQATVVLENIMVSPGPVSLLQKLEGESLIAKKPDGSYKKINSINFPEHFDAYSLLHKVSLLVTKMEIDKKDLEWFIVNYTVVNTINFSALPITATINPNDFNGWRNLYLFLNFKSNFPEPEDASIRSILDLAKDVSKTKEEIFAGIAKFTQWDSNEISSLHTGLKIQHVTGHRDYTNAKLYHRMLRCFEQMKLAGVYATTMFSWASITTDTTLDRKVAEQARQAVKSKYEQDDWLQKVTPLHNAIRDKKRTALVEYHLENSQRNESTEIIFNGKTIPNPLYWKNSNSLFKYFLIDAEMSACQLTSRMKQALSSVQLFVQRCFLNLENRYVEVAQDEKEDTSSPNAWSQWRWMKNYRIWEANRKIFFYPENWLEPEMRDDKSSFFKELENELFQNEVTKENVEEAFHNYLYKVDEVSHLEVCGMYHQMEDLNPDEVGYETNIVHVIGRTKAIPNIYYYRTYDMNYSTWSAWEKIDVDITGDHVVPVVYNRKLHLFWLQFMEKSMKTKKVPAAQPTDGPTEAAEPMKVLEIQLGWSIKKSGGWTPKKISKQKLIHPWERPHYSYNLKPYYRAEFNELYLDIYLSTSKEFNDSTFYDPNVKLENNPVYLTKNRFHETYLPWHSSSFVFNGEIKEVKLKGLGGHYNFLGWEFWLDDSYDYVHEKFGSDGEQIKELDPKYEYGPRLKLPNGMHFHNTHLTNNRKDSKNDQALRVLENSNTSTLLSGAISPFELVITQQDLQLNTITTNHPMFYQDNQRAFFIKPEWETRLNNYGQLISRNRKYRFMPFYHPYTLLFIRELNRDGIDGVLNRKIQTKPESYVPKNNFKLSSYSLTSSVIVDKTAIKDIVDFSFNGANSIYNWELFFHAPLMIACRLMQNQKFEDAMHWFHYIFNPTDIENYSTPQRYWTTKPFFEYNSDDYRKQRIESILSNINLKENVDKLTAWKNNPFKPHVIARYRPVAYQKNVVMKYLDNLIAWGDMLFKRDTIESINKASLLYMLAYEILGDRPKKVPNVKHEELTFNELETKLDEFGNVRVDVIVEDTLLPITVIPSSSSSEPIPKLETFYYCIPNNDFLTKYWDTVEDRLFKIRHCMNIQGIVRQLPLFEPPIDPALLVKAAAAGMDLSSVLNDLSAPTPYYRFRIVVQKAIEFCNEVKILGEKLLSALEKKDVEKLSLLRSQHEIQLLKAVKEVCKKQIDEAVETIGSLNEAFKTAEARKTYYDELPRMNDLEIGGTVLHGLGIGSEIGATIANIIAAGTSLIPQFPAGVAGFGGSPYAVLEYGGKQASSSAAQWATFFHGLSTIAHAGGSMLETQGSYTRRDEENKHQADLATIEKDQIQFQINAAEIRQAIAEKELENQELQIENAKTVDDYMRNKFSNDQLYSWMVTQISTVYFQAYQLAFDMAKKAEKCYQYELGITNSNIVQFGYWDSLKKGLLSGDKLMNDLRRLEAEYINQNRREFEITKHISLAQMSPLTLVMLKETGKCTIALPEWLFDMDYPGHYMRRIKNVSLSIPCVTGPFTGVNCTLSLLRNETRMDAILSGGNYEKQVDDTRFKTMFGAISSIATSNAQNDSGMFELNFNDERYLPFEGAGVISDWQISMPIENNYFDFASLSDVVLHISYTSRSGGGQLKTAANTALQTKLPTQTARLFSLKYEFATEWHKFLNPANGNDQEFVANLKDEHFPFFIRGKINSLKIKTMDVFVESSVEGNFSFTSNIKVTNAASLDGLSIDRDSDFNNVHHISKEFTAGSLPNSMGEIRVKIKVKGIGDFKSLTTDQIDDIFILFQLGN